jgi:PKHD-type hydroxylase
MKGLWALWADELSDETCNSITETALALPEQTATIGGRVIDTVIRESHVRWIHPEVDGIAPFFGLINKYFATANRDFFGVDSVFTPALQFTIYRESRRSHYTWHADVFWETDQIFQRKLSMVIQLSDPSTYEGGELELDCNVQPQQSELRKRGSIIVFPSFLHHRVTPVTKGVRNSLVTWQEGPLWR